MKKKTAKRVIFVCLTIIGLILAPFVIEFTSFPTIDFSKNDVDVEEVEELETSPSQEESLDLPVNEKVIDEEDTISEEEIVPLTDCDIYDFAGFYRDKAGDACSLFMNIYPTDENTLTVDVTDISGTPNCSWHMSGTIDTDSGVLRYSDCVKETHESSEEGEDKSEEIYNNGSGEFVFTLKKKSDDDDIYRFSLTWKDYMEDSYEEKLAYMEWEAVKAEDLLGGYWGIPNDGLIGYTTMFEFKEDGTVTAYYFDETEEKQSYETTWRIEGLKLAIDNVDGEKTYYKFMTGLGGFDKITSCTVTNNNYFRSHVHYKDSVLNNQGAVAFE